MEDKPNYYALLPANIRYDERLNAQQKIMYSEITALSNVYGYCFASNKYFSKLYGCSSITISRWINTLKQYGYIRVEMDRNPENNNLLRKIYISEYVLNREIVNGKEVKENDKGGIVKNDNRGIIKNDDRGIVKNVKYNNIKNNNTSINRDIAEKKTFLDNVRLTDDELESLKTEFGEQKANKAIKELSLYKKSSGKQYNDDYATIKLWVIERIDTKEEKLSKVKSPNKMKDMDFDEYYDVGR